MTRLLTCLLTALAFLPACALDKEAALRAQLSAWVELGETFFFQSSMSCTAAVFHTAENPRITSLVKRARSLNTGMTMLETGEPVMFAVAGKSPNAVTEDIMSRDLPQGLEVLNSGLAGLTCMTDLVKSVYYQAIRNPASTLVFVPETGAMVVLDKQAMALIYVRGNG
ncbi:hypothetical protein K3718_06035 [Leisingera aquaemixtae]|uniref:Lipoprotein n=1 Tax=Leisingera aquaemixtae TaxID=1396826 RepID=A0ABY5WMA3_9RHOB|nr:hypothetical protein [Leisingera aquaemixtae]UWQ42646.1 hypothetical protein K3718_06035 [Leisingera aquaemixtae]